MFFKKRSNQKQSNIASLPLHRFSLYEKESLQNSTQIQGRLPLTIRIHFPHCSFFSKPLRR
jgi:hypothetical protein